MKKATLIVGLALVAGVAGADQVLIKETASSGEPALAGQFKVIEQEDGSKVFAVEKRGSVTSKNKFAITSGKNYRLSVKIKTLGEEPSLAYIGVAPYDAQNRYINTHNVMAIKETFTELAASCEPSDTVIKIKDGGNWRKTGYFVIAFEVSDDESDLPNFNTSQYIKSVEERDGVYEITLSKEIGKSYPAGTKVRQHQMGGYVYAKAAPVPVEWTLWEGKLEGRQLRMGASGVLLLLCNTRPEDKDKTILFDELTIVETE